MKAHELIAILSLDPEAEVRVAAVYEGCIPVPLSQNDITNNPEAHAWIISPPKPCLVPSQLVQNERKYKTGPSDLCGR